MNQQTVLVVDDEPDIRELLVITLSRMGLQTLVAAGLGEAIGAVDARPPDLCLTDMRLPDGDGIELVHHIQREHPHIPVAMITAHGSVEAAIAALKAGAFDFISKPLELDRLRKLVDSALQLQGPGGEAEDLTDQELLGETEVIAALRRQIGKLGRSQAPVHIHGESGSGKEVVARLIHKHSPRVDGPFLAVNCGAIPSELMESELFGHVKGAFTGANQDKMGLFQAAAGGTLFLDEVADLPLDMQVKLLRAIQEKSVRPVGSSQEIATDVRLLSATHRNLGEEVESGRFRNDLYYRINVIDVLVPSLRERKADLPMLASALLKRVANQNGIDQASLHPSAIEALSDYDFPGNVRELENILERSLALSETSEIYASDLQFPSRPPRWAAAGTPSSAALAATPAATAVATSAHTSAPESGPAAAAAFDPSSAFGDLEGYLERIERDILAAALERSRWNKTAAARLLGISFRSLRYRLKKLGLDD